MWITTVRQRVNIFIAGDRKINTLPAITHGEAMKELVVVSSDLRKEGEPIFIDIL